MRYHIYWQDKILLKDLDEEEFKNIWEKMHWVYNNELNYVEVIRVHKINEIEPIHNPTIIYNNIFGKVSVVR